MTYVSVFGPQVALGQASPEQWLILWSTVPGKQTLFLAWVWTSRPIASLINRTVKGTPLSQDEEQYRLAPPLKSGYQWYALQGSIWGAWWQAKHIAWVYTNGEGYMAINGSLMRDEVSACNRLRICNLLSVPGGNIL